MAINMRRSHLEIYVEIISVLAQKGPLKLTRIMYKANLNCTVLKEDLGFLVKRGLVEERTIGKAKTVFAVTQRGINVLKYFRELNQALSIVEEARNEALAILEMQFSLNFASIVCVFRN